MGIKKRKPDDIRIRFQIDSQKLDSKGRYIPEVQGIGGAFTDDVPFARGLDISEEERAMLPNPEDMLIISEKMESELRRWKNGQFMPNEKEMLEKLPEKSREAFMHRVNGILLQVDLSGARNSRQICASGYRNRDYVPCVRVLFHRRSWGIHL